MSNHTVLECVCGAATVSTAQMGIQIATLVGSFLAAFFASQRCRVKSRWFEINVKPNNAPLTPGSARGSPAATKLAEPSERSTIIDVQDTP